ncbi:hypothetical protein Mth01_41310 [Sphaerimonospora thailandensis]|uniref:Uncharacterized protein n=1 Tax=Sphaerimonospora thailandensis TaxID=795644 RepID=A0A8J3RGE3_9ACTN|nr:hypothetical protein Mth01_41310 [Sphaerimonospora thailandensis]
MSLSVTAQAPGVARPPGTPTPGDAPPGDSHVLSLRTPPNGPAGMSSGLLAVPPKAPSDVPDATAHAVHIARHPPATSTAKPTTPRIVSPLLRSPLRLVRIHHCPTGEVPGPVSVISPRKSWQKIMNNRQAKDRLAL